MKRITLPKILRSLETLEYQVVVEPAVAEKPGGRSSGCSTWSRDTLSKEKHGQEERIHG